MNVKTIATDFDGVIHRYSKGWQDGLIYDPPMDGAIEKINMLIAKGFKVVVFTAREDLDAVRDWLSVWGFPTLEVTNQKIPAIAYIDDRAIRFTDWEDIIKYFI
jgi:hydroxymethylpyrimidine pyrophosphatase-like HAD family hydrolase